MPDPETPAPEGQPVETKKQPTVRLFNEDVLKKYQNGTVLFVVPDVDPADAARFKTKAIPNYDIDQALTEAQEVGLDLIEVADGVVRVGDKNDYISRRPPTLTLPEGWRVCYPMLIAQTGAGDDARRRIYHCTVLWHPGNPDDDTRDTIQLAMSWMSHKDQFSRGEGRWEAFDNFGAFNEEKGVGTNGTPYQVVIPGSSAARRVAVQEMVLAVALAVKLPGRPTALDRFNQHFFV